MVCCLLTPVSTRPLAAHLTVATSAAMTGELWLATAHRDTFVVDPSAVSQSVELPTTTTTLLLATPLRSTRTPTCPSTDNKATNNNLGDSSNLNSSGINRSCLNQCSLGGEILMQPR